MKHAPRVLLVHPSGPLPQALRALGCHVLELAPAQAGLFHLPAELARLDFAPDILLQFERLGPRLLLSGLEELPAVRMFWALDPHLNAFWQAPYLRLFDVALSTQLRWSPALRDCGAAEPLHLPWHAPDRPFTPFRQRPRQAGFVGRLGPTRPARAWLAELMGRLLPQGFELADGLTVQAMLDFYCETQAVPNESITGEVNFRLFEAAGCGCAVLAQDLGPEQAAHFEPGREMFVCADALELAETLRLLHLRPRLAEAVGRAAWERAQAEHLPAARARAVLAAAASATRRGATARDAPLWLALALARLCEPGRLDPRAHGAAEALDRLGAQTGPAATALLLDARLRLAHALGQGEALRALLSRVEADAAALFDAEEPFAPRLACTCSMLFLGLGGAPLGQPDLPRARAFARRAGVPDSAPASSGPAAAHLLLAWADRLDRLGAPERGGFGFDAARHLPACASECLYAAQHLDPGNQDALRGLDGLLAREPGAEALRVGLLSDLSLRAPSDWRVSLGLGLAGLRSFRHGPGLAELLLARQTAAETGEADAFLKALAREDPSGRILRALERQGLAAGRDAP